MDEAALRVQAVLSRLDAEGRVQELPESTHTAAQAAAALGTEPDRIAKSLVFVTGGGAPVLVVASGAHRVDPELLAAVVGEPVRPADPAAVVALTGFPVGGVPPVGHEPALPAVLDRALFGKGRIWAAAGTPHAVFPTTAEELLRLTGGRIAELAAGRG